MVATYDGHVIAIAKDGVDSGESALSGAFTNLLRLDVGGLSNSASLMMGSIHISRLAYFPQALTALDRQRITA